MKKLGILAVMAVLITGLLTLGAGTAHAGWSLVELCTSDGNTYKLKKKSVYLHDDLYGMKKNDIWVGKNLSESGARNLSPCM